MNFIQAQETVKDYLAYRLLKHHKDIAIHTSNSTSNNDVYPVIVDIKDIKTNITLVSKVFYVHRCYNEDNDFERRADDILMQLDQLCVA